MVDVSFSDQLAILGIVATVIVGIVIFNVQLRLSDKVNNAILERKTRDDKRKKYHLIRLKANTAYYKRSSFLRNLLISILKIQLLIVGIILSLFLREMQNQ
jgi:hypothetical protein